MLSEHLKISTPVFKPFQMIIQHAVTFKMVLMALPLSSGLKGASSDIRGITPFLQLGHIYIAN